MKQEKIGIQGVTGAFHEIAARHYFKEQPIEIVPTDTFDNLIEELETSSTDTSMMAIENSIAGSLLGNYLLLVNAKVSIVGEIFLRIRHNLMALPGIKIENIKEVHSHPVALAQCKPFLKQYPHLKLVSSEDTAKSAKLIQENNLQDIAAIASSLASNLYGLNIISQGIETNKMNYTRFLILKKESASVEQFNKVTLSFSVSHKVGSLYEILGLFKYFKTNMSKIQSVPLVGSQGQYIFFVDLIIEDFDLYPLLIVQLKKHTQRLKILGQYQKGLYYES